jgi:hypothetical protein
MSESILSIVAALLVGLCVGSFGSGITRCAHEPAPKLLAGPSP